MEIGSSSNAVPIAFFNVEGKQRTLPLYAAQILLCLLETDHQGRYIFGSDAIRTLREYLHTLRMLIAVSRGEVSSAVDMHWEKWTEARNRFLSVCGSAAASRLEETFGVNIAASGTDGAAFPHSSSNVITAAIEFMERSEHLKWSIGETSRSMRNTLSSKVLI
ncbi:MAG: hypothetical protein KC680_03620 [Candidatus Peregrinibacteria bacterium]|nr:hypothetical protein [Candidatus Peregrinibacteria bacterium]MCB9808723.1 hypothetical protein [Candidatus Peribacteria bacterium]